MISQASHWHRDPNGYTRIGYTMGENARSTLPPQDSDLNQRLSELTRYLERTGKTEQAEIVSTATTGLVAQWNQPSGGDVRELYDTLELVQAHVGTILDVIEAQFGHEIERGHR